MLMLFRALSDRLKALFVADVASDFEAQLMNREAERRADLLRQAKRYQEEGLHGIAQHLRQRAEAISYQKPMASVLPSLDHWAETASIEVQPVQPKLSQTLKKGRSS